MRLPSKNSVSNFFSAIVNSLTMIVNVTILIFVIGSCVLVFSVANRTGPIESIQSYVSEDSILTLNLDGIIYGRTKFLENFNKYIKHKKIKGVLIQINSPGGGLAATQEIHREIHRLKNFYKKPVVVSIRSMAASGGFYIAMAGDKVVANEGSLLGSIGVVMVGYNAEKLIEWAKLEPMVIKTGEFKDSFSFHRSITNRERDFFQDFLNQALEQFKNTIVQDRKLSRELVDDFADARIFLGQTGVDQGFIDQTGNYYDALNLVGEMSGLGENPPTFKPPKEIDYLPNIIFDVSLGNLFSTTKPIKSSFQSMLNSNLRGRPLYLALELIGF